MLDSHVHFGQFNEVYYDFDRIFEAIFTCGKIDSIVYSTTSSCIHDVKYKFIRNEIEKITKKYPIDIALPLFWVVPNYIKQGIKVYTAMTELNYGGIKLHPYGNKWNFEDDKEQYEILHEVFDYADKHSLRILIHTGESGVDSPSRFERFFAEYKNAMIILAHCRPANETIRIMQKFSNVFGDVAFATKERIDAINIAGFGKRLIFGTDFPITHYFYSKNNEITFEEQYKNDFDNSIYLLKLLE